MLQIPAMRDARAARRDQQVPPRDLEREREPERQEAADVGEHEHRDLEHGRVPDPQRLRDRRLEAAVLLGLDEAAREELGGGAAEPRPHDHLDHDQERHREERAGVHPVVEQERHRHAARQVSLARREHQHRQPREEGEHQGAARELGRALLQQADALHQPVRRSAVDERQRVDQVSSSRARGARTASGAWAPAAWALTKPWRRQPRPASGPASCRGPSPRASRRAPSAAASRPPRRSRSAAARIASRRARSSPAAGSP